MRSLENKTIIKQLNGNQLEIAIGELYVILKDYNFYSSGDFGNSDILVVMPTAIALGRSCVQLYAICMNNTHGLTVSGSEKNGLTITNDTGTDSKAHIVIPFDELAQLMKQMPQCECYMADISDWSIDIHALYAQCTMEDFINMNIAPINVRWTDIRQWPKGAIHQWARDHLQLPSEQLAIVKNFEQRWKMIAYAQEAFTYQCTDFNPIAKKKVNASKKALKKEAVEGMSAEAEAQHYHPFGRTITLGHPKFMTVGPGDINTIEHFFESPVNRRTYHLLICKKVIRGTKDIEVTAHVDGVIHESVIDHEDIRPADLCVLKVDGYAIHISQYTERHEDQINKYTECDKNQMKRLKLNYGERTYHPQITDLEIERGNQTLIERGIQEVQHDAVSDPSEDETAPKRKSGIVIGREASCRGPTYDEMAHIITGSYDIEPPLLKSKCAAAKQYEQVKWRHEGNIFEKIEEIPEKMNKEEKFEEKIEEHLDRHPREKVNDDE